MSYQTSEPNCEPNATLTGQVSSKRLVSSMPDNLKAIEDSVDRIATPKYSPDNRDIIMMGK